MKKYKVTEYSETGLLVVSEMVFDSQKELKNYLSEHGASYDAHKLSTLGNDSIVIYKIDLDGDYIEIEELALPGKTDCVYIDGIEYISLNNAMVKHDMTLSQVKYAVESRGLKKFSAGMMNRIFVEDKFV